MSKFSVKLSFRAVVDINNGVDYYNDIQKDLGKRFGNDVKSSINKIKRNPFFQIRYDNIRCLPLGTFPFMIHFEVLESNNLIIIYGIINTYLNTDNWIKD